MLRGVSHGTEATLSAPGVTENQAGEAVAGTAFSHMFPALAEEFPVHHLPNTDPAATVEALKKLKAAMVEDPPEAADPLQSTQNSMISPVYTYWGQFIDHDLTLNTDGSDDHTLGSITKADLTPFHRRRSRTTCATAAIRPSTWTRSTVTGPRWARVLRARRPTSTTGPG